MIREITENDLNSLLELYLHLHEVSIPTIDEHVVNTWRRILNDDNYHIIVVEEDGILVSSCTCIIVPNMTRGVTPYALIENVVTHADYRKRGYATQVLEYAGNIAEQEGCYKMMLMTGSSNPDTHAFYKKAGYKADGKTAYVRMLKEVNWRR